MPASPILPARVNPVLLHESELRRSVSDGWRFRLDPDDVGIAASWSADPSGIADPIAVPGSWQGQGFGHDGDDYVWDFRLRTRVFRATYAGAGWYAVELGAPDAWSGRRIFLSFGGAHPSAQVWLNGELLGAHGMPFVPFGFEVGRLLRPGQDNSLVVRIHEANREFGLAYSWQGNWSGLYRTVELTATGRLALRSLWLYPDLSGQRLLLRPRVDGAVDGAACSLRVSLTPLSGGGQTLTSEFPVRSDSSQIVMAVPSPHPWSPDQPNLYRLDCVLLADGEVSDARSDRLGFIDFQMDGKLFRINGEPYYMRGTGDFVSCPETGCPDTDRDRWRRKLQTLRDYGYNYVRCQSYVYAPEYFDAADEVGLLVQSEMGMLGGWAGHSPWHVYQWPQPTPENYALLKRQWDLIVERDLSHPSACLYCMSNELGGDTHYPRIARQCARDTKAIRPNALVLWTDGGYNPDLPSDFVNWSSTQAAGLEAPVIEHEFQWWSSFPDVRIAEKYSGATRPYAIQMARDAAKRYGLEHLLEEMARNSQRLQFVEAKAKMEQCRRDNAELAGICHFNAMDANPSPQGIFDEFYELKHADAATWLQTNGDTAVLSSLGFDDRVCVAGDTLRCSLFVSDFSHPPFGAATVSWRLAAGEAVLASGELPFRGRPYRTEPVGEIAATIPELIAPMPATLCAELSDGQRRVSNAWTLWIFPRGELAPNGLTIYGEPRLTWLRGWEAAPRLDIAGPVARRALVLTERLDAALIEYVRRGGRVLLAASEGLVRPHLPNFGIVRYFFTPPANYPPYEDGQNGTIITDHPMLSGFPHEGFADLQFYRMIDNSPPLDLGCLGEAGRDPVIRVIHRYPVCRPLGYLLEARCGEGSLILSALDLNPDWAEAACLLGGIRAYVATGEVAPCMGLDEDVLELLLQMAALP